MWTSLSPWNLARREGEQGVSPPPRPLYIHSKACTSGATSALTPALPLPLSSLRGPSQYQGCLHSACLPAPPLTPGDPVQPLDLPSPPQELPETSGTGIHFSKKKWSRTPNCNSPLPLPPTPLPSPAQFGSSFLSHLAKYSGLGKECLPGQQRFPSQPAVTSLQRSSWVRPEIEAYRGLRMSH